MSNRDSVNSWRFFSSVLQLILPRSDKPSLWERVTAGVGFGPWSNASDELIATQALD